MTMAVNGVAKLTEECGELLQVIGKRMAYWSTDDHPDGKGSLSVRMEEEMGDVRAAIEFVIDNMGLSRSAVISREMRKRALFEQWHADPDNNVHALMLPSCSVCRCEVRWVESPTGGWWQHIVHPDDDHDAQNYMVEDPE